MRPSRPPYVPQGHVYVSTSHRPSRGRLAVKVVLYGVVAVALGLLFILAVGGLAPVPAAPPGPPAIRVTPSPTSGPPPARSVDL